MKLLITLFCLLPAVAMAEDFQLGCLSEIITCVQAGGECSSPATTLEVKTIELNKKGYGELVNSLEVKGSKAFTKVAVQKQKAGYEISIVAGWGTNSENGFATELGKYLVENAQQINFNTYYGPKVTADDLEFTPYITLTPPF